MKTTKHNITNTAEPIKPGYKKTSIGIIPEEWEVKKLDSLGIKVKSGGNKVKKEKGKYKVFGSTGIIGYTDKYVYNEKLILCARVGANAGFIYDVEEKCDISDNTLILFNFGKIDRKFYQESLTQYNLNRLVFGSGQPLVTGSLLKQIKLPIPPLAEQTVIADCLSTWDKGIEKLSALIASKKEQKKGLMQQLLTGKKRLDGFTEEWKTKRLNVIGKVNYGTRIVKGNVEEGEYFVYGGGGKTFTNKEYNREDRMIIARFAMSKECARFVKGKFYLNDSGLTVDANEKTNQSFLDYLLFFNQHNIYKLRAGGAQQNLDVQAFRGISLSIPSIEEQTAIAEVLTAADKEIELLEQKLEAFKIQKKGLMQVLLTGTKRLV